MRYEIVVQAGQSSTKHRVRFSFFNTTIIDPTTTTTKKRQSTKRKRVLRNEKKKREGGDEKKPRAPAKGRSGEVEGDAGGHFEVELVEEAL